MANPARAPSLAQTDSVTLPCLPRHITSPGQYLTDAVTKAVLILANRGAPKIGGEAVCDVIVALKNNIRRPPLCVQGDKN